MGKPEQRRDALDDIAAYYSSNNEETRLSNQQLEFEVTKRLLARYLPPKSKVLELGAGTGRYTLELLKEKHEVTSLELVPSLVDTSRKAVKQAGFSADLLTGDARDFRDQVKKTDFDAVLAMGPFYHLISAKDRSALVDHMKEVVKPGGLVITVHLTRIGLIGYMLTRFPAWGLEQPEQIKQIMTAGHLPDHPRNGDFRGYFTSLSEIRNLHENQDLEIVQMHSQDPCIGSVDEIFNRLPEDIKAAWADNLTALSHDPLALGSGRGIICVARRKK